MVSGGRRIFSEWLGTAFLLAAVVGSGIMAQKLSGGNVALALLCNTIPTGAILVVLILVFGPLSGAHLNPAVSLAFALKRELSWPFAAGYILAQLAGAVTGVLAAHTMFELPIWQFATTARVGAGQWAAEFVATFGLMLTILGLCGEDALSHSVCGRPLHHLRLLVHGVHLICKSRCDHRTRPLRHIRRYRARRSARLHRGATDRSRHGRAAGRMAVGVCRIQRCETKSCHRWANGLSGQSRFRDIRHKAGPRQ
jgi:glycerol uptake facilitator-like aquaporin